MSALSVHFNKKLNQSSRVVGDKFRKVEVDSKGIEHVSFLPVDYPSIQSANGKAEDWSLNTLLKAGISPAFPIHTTFGTRIEAENYIESVRTMVDSLFPESTLESVTESTSESVSES